MNFSKLASTAMYNDVVCTMFPVLCAAQMSPVNLNQATNQAGARRRCCIDWGRAQIRLIGAGQIIRLIDSPDS